MELTNTQKQKLWSLACVLTQSNEVWYDEDHEYDDEREAYIKAIEAILATPSPQPRKGTE